MTVKEQNIKYAKISESFKKYPYKCPAGKWTIGFGFNIEDNPIPKFIEDGNLWHEGQELSLNVAEQWLDYLIDATISELKTAIPEFDDLEDYIQFVLTDMCYNMGITKLLGFKKMLHAMVDGNRARTVIEMIDSKWFEQVKSRAIKLIRVIGDSDIEEAF